MLFRRRKKAPWPARLREFFWPRKGFTRPVRYLAKRILRISASPHAIATGVAAGTFSAFTPLLGFHAILALALAWLLAGNLIAAALATLIANPVTIPLIAVATLSVGEVFLGVHGKQAVTASELFDMLEQLEFRELWTPVLRPMLAGAGLLGSAAAVLAYGVTRIAVATFHRRRKAGLRAAAGPSAIPHGDPSL